MSRFDGRSKTVVIYRNHQSVQSCCLHSLSILTKYVIDTAQLKSDPCRFRLSLKLSGVPFCRTFTNPIFALSKYAKKYRTQHGNSTRKSSFLTRDRSSAVVQSMKDVSGSCWCTPSSTLSIYLCKPQMKPYHRYPRPGSGRTPALMTTHQCGLPLLRAQPSSPGFYS